MLKICVVSGFEVYGVAASRKGVLVRHMACSMRASFRARATMALRVPILSAAGLSLGLKLREGWERSDALPDDDTTPVDR